MTSVLQKVRKDDDECIQNPAPAPVGFDHLSSIDSGDNNDDHADAGEVLEALKGTISPKNRHPALQNRNSR